MKEVDLGVKCAFFFFISPELPLPHAGTCAHVRTDTHSGLFDCRHDYRLMRDMLLDMTMDLMIKCMSELFIDLTMDMIIE